MDGKKSRLNLSIGSKERNRKNIKIFKWLIGFKKKNSSWGDEIYERNKMNKLWIDLTKAK